MSKEVSIGTFEAFMGVHCQYIPDGTGRVNVNLIGSNKDEEIVFHHDARADHLGDKDALVLNTLFNGKWLKEERPSGFPFTPGVNVAVTAVCNVTNAVAVYANGKSIANYKIQGNVQIGDVKGIWIHTEENRKPQVGIVAIGRVSNSSCMHCT